jgi:hypothetical protein
MRTNAGTAVTEHIEDNLRQNFVNSWTVPPRKVPTICLKYMVRFFTPQNKKIIL